MDQHFYVVVDTSSMAHLVTNCLLDEGVEATWNVHRHGYAIKIEGLDALRVAAIMKRCFPDCEFTFMGKNMLRIRA